MSARGPTADIPPWTHGLSARPECQSLAGNRDQQYDVARPETEIDAMVLFAETAALAARDKLLLAFIGHAPDRAVAVVADQQRAVVRHRQANRPAPDGCIVEHETGQEIFVFSRGD